jgi:uncharacterized membrane protein
MWGGGYAWPFWWMFPTLTLFFLIVVGAIFVFVWRSAVHGPRHWGPPARIMDRPWGWGDPTYSALQILNERFARGEIPKDEYEQKKAAILSGGRP